MSMDNITVAAFTDELTKIGKVGKLWRASKKVKKKQPKEVSELGKRINEAYQKGEFNVHNVLGT